MRMEIKLNHRKCLTKTREGENKIENKSQKMQQIESSRET
jgi:hypothetical protein